MNQKVSTSLGVAIILVMVFTAGYFVWVIERNNDEQGDYVPGSISSNKTVDSILLKQTKLQDTDKQNTTDGNNTADWISYQNSNLDVVFQYPRSWVLSKADTNFGADEFEIKFNRFNVDFKDDIRILGNNDSNILRDAMQPYFGQCAQETKGLEQFCSDGDCIEINEHTKMRYEAPMMVERVFIAYIYTDLSSKYPNLCVEATLGEMYNVVSNTKKSYGDGYGGYNVRAYIDNNMLSDNLRSYIADLTKFAASIKKK